jgi:hypothetical protein
LTKSGILGILYYMEEVSSPPDTGKRERPEVARPASSNKGITRRKAIKVGVFTLATALPVVMTMWPKEAHGQTS